MAYSAVTRFRFGGLLGVVLLVVFLADLRVHVGELEAGRDQEWELRGLGARLRTGPLEEAVKQRHADVHLVGEALARVAIP